MKISGKRETDLYDLCWNFNFCWWGPFTWKIQL